MILTGTILTRLAQLPRPIHLGILALEETLAQWLWLMETEDHHREMRARTIPSSFLILQGLAAQLGHSVLREQGRSVKTFISHSIGIPWGQQCLSWKMLLAFCSAHAYVEESSLLSLSKECFLKAFHFWDASVSTCWEWLLFKSSSWHSKIFHSTVANH